MRPKPGHLVLKAGRRWWSLGTEGPAPPPQPPVMRLQPVGAEMDVAVGIALTSRLSEMLLLVPTD